jgi:hypothetical protein
MFRHYQGYTITIDIKRASAFTVVPPLDMVCDEIRNRSTEIKGVQEAAVIASSHDDGRVQLFAVYVKMAPSLNLSLKTFKTFSEHLDAALPYIHGITFVLPEVTYRTTDSINRKFQIEARAKIIDTMTEPYHFPIISGFVGPNIRLQTERENKRLRTALLQKYVVKNLYQDILNGINADDKIRGNIFDFKTSDIITMQETINSYPNAEFEIAADRLQSVFTKEQEILLLATNSDAKRLSGQDAQKGYLDQLQQSNDCTGSSLMTEIVSMEYPEADEEHITRQINIYEQFLQELHRKRRLNEGIDSL